LSASETHQTARREKLTMDFAGAQPIHGGLVERVNQIEGVAKTFAFVGAALCGRPVDRARRSAGGHKARPYAMHFLFNFDEARA
jgi:hypothetical protein